MYIKIRSIATSIAVLGTTLLNTGCKNNNKIIQPVEKQAQTIIKDTIPKNYADLEVYCGFDPGFNLKIENGVSFIADNTKYSAINGKIQGELININDSLKHKSDKFSVEKRDYSLSTIETIKMLAQMQKNFSIKKENPICVSEKLET